MSSKEEYFEKVVTWEEESDSEGVLLEKLSLWMGIIFVFTFVSIFIIRNLMGDLEPVIMVFTAMVFIAGLLGGGTIGTGLVVYLESKGKGKRVLWRKVKE